MFSYLYGKVLHWAKHHHAPYYLAGVSFAESSVFPIPPDVMLIPMVLGKPLSAWWYAFISTIASVLGGAFGYLIGYFAFETFGYSILVKLDYVQQYQHVTTWFDVYGWHAVLIAGFTPIPYKIFTIAAGAAKMSMLSFLLASALGRGLRFFLVAFLVKTIGKKLESKLIRYIDWIGWGFVILCAIVFAGYHVYKA